MNLEQYIRYYIDKGLSYEILLAALTGVGDHGWLRDEDSPTFEREEAERAIDDLIENRILAVGPGKGHQRFLVVREWMPNTAKRIEEEAHLEKMTAEILGP